MGDEELVELNKESTNRPDVISSLPVNNVNTFQKKPETKWKNIKMQVLSSTLISSCTMHMGMTISFPNLLKVDMGHEMISNFASIGALMTPIGSCMTSLLTDRFGRKVTLIVLELLSVLTWFMVALVDKENQFLFYTSGAAAGITRGALTSHSPAFISEITHNEHRQMFLSFTTFFFTIAYCLTSLLNLWLTWKSAAWCFGFIFIILTILTIFFVPESPHWWAVIKMDSNKAKSTLREYCPNPKTFALPAPYPHHYLTSLHCYVTIHYHITRILKILWMFEQEWSVIQKKMQSVQTSKSKTKLSSLILQPTVYKPSIILLVLLLFQQACCIYPLSAYALMVLPEISKPLEKYKSQIFVAISGVRLFIAIVTTIFLSRFNQKQLLSVSFIGMLLFSVPLVGIEMFKMPGLVAEESSWNEWLTVLSFVLYTAFGCIGAVGVPWTIIFELLPTEARGLLGPYFVAFGYVLMATFLKGFLPVMKMIGIIYTFSIIGLVCLAGSVFIRLCVPETRGKSLSDIENRFSVKK